MADHKYRVVREHIGDKPYAVGDERTASPGDVGHLVGRVLEDLGPVKEKAEPGAQNKAEGDSPSNKAEKPAHSKGAKKDAAQ